MNRIPEDNVQVDKVQKAYWSTEDELRFLEYIGSYRPRETRSQLTKKEHLEKYIEAAEKRDKWDSINKHTILSYCTRKLESINKHSN